MTREEMIQYYMKEYGVIRIIAERMFQKLYLRRTIDDHSR